MHPVDLQIPLKIANTSTFLFVRDIFLKKTWLEFSSSSVATRGELGVRTPYVTNVTSYLVTFLRILQNLYFIYPIWYV